MTTVPPESLSEAAVLRAATWPDCAAGAPAAATPDAQLIQQLQAQLTSLHKAIQVINHLAVELDIRTAMDHVHDVAMELLECEKVTLFLTFEKRGELRARPSNDSGICIRVQFGEGIAGTVAQTGELMNIKDAYAHPLFNMTVDKATGFTTRNMLCCAIQDLSGRNVAVLQALNKTGGRSFSSDDEYNLRLVGTHLGNTLSKSRLVGQATHEKERLTALHATFRQLASAGDLSEVVDTVSDAVQRILHAEHAFVFLADAPRRELWTQWYSAASSSHGTARVPFGEGLLGRCAEDRSRICLTVVPADDPVVGLLMAVIGKPCPVSSMLVQPVLDASSGRVLAVMVAINKREKNNEADLFFEEQYNEADWCALGV